MALSCCVSIASVYWLMALNANPFALMAVAWSSFGELEKKAAETVLTSALLLKSCNKNPLPLKTKTTGSLLWKNTHGLLLSAKEVLLLSVASSSIVFCLSAQALGCRRWLPRLAVVEELKNPWFLRMFSGDFCIFSLSYKVPWLFLGNIFLSVFWGLRKS